MKEYLSLKLVDLNSGPSSADYGIHIVFSSIGEPEYSKVVKVVDTAIQ